MWSSAELWQRRNLPAPRSSLRWTGRRHFVKALETSLHHRFSNPRITWHLRTNAELWEEIDLQQPLMLFSTISQTAAIKAVSSKISWWSWQEALCQCFYIQIMWFLKKQKKTADPLLFAPTLHQLIKAYRVHTDLDLNSVCFNFHKRPTETDALSSFTHFMEKGYMKGALSYEVRFHSKLPFVTFLWSLNAMLCTWWMQFFCKGPFEMKYSVTLKHSTVCSHYQHTITS